MVISEKILGLWVMNCCVKVAKDCKAFCIIRDGDDIVWKNNEVVGEE